MNHKTIELQILQLEEAFSKSRSNIYSDDKKSKYFNELYNLFLAIRDSDYKNFEASNLKRHRDYLTTIFLGLEYLDNSILNVIPFEIVSCLELALNDWIDKKNFILVTSLSNRINDFRFESNDTEESFRQFNNAIFDLYSLNISFRLIKIILPKDLSRDYLSCVALYHELGHFVDIELNISNKLFYKRYKKLPILFKNVTEYRFFYHCLEFFADLFAAQYIHNAANLFLNHIAHQAPDSDTHPATEKRMKVVENFLSDNTCMEISRIQEVLVASRKPLIEKRYKIIDETNSNLVNLVPQKISNTKELHYIFKLGWSIWNDSDSNFLKEFKPRQKYNIVNNLVEKSISNYIIINEWESKLP